MQYWMVKQEPTAYAWSQFVEDKGTTWTGVRNFQARNNLRAMKKGDLVLYYHSVVGKEVVGLAKVATEAYPDPTAKEGDWVCVDLKPVRGFKKSVPLEAIKKTAALKDMALLKNSRLSVMPVTAREFEVIEKLAT